MPSPVPVTRLLPKDFYPSLDLGPCSSPLTKHSDDTTLKVPAARHHGRVASRLWSSVIHWKELRSVEPVASGGFGSVYRAQYFGETVAVKKVKKCAKNKLASRQSFWAELNAAHVRHENVVRVVAATTCVPANAENEDNIGTILMEYVGDRNLHHVIYVSADALGADRWCRYSGDILRGLHFLHSHGVVHLDLKPANVLLSGEDVCKIADFGSSLKLERGRDAVAPCPSHVGGTYTHRAPELLKGEEVTPAADVYSFGITLWQLLARAQPYAGDRQHVMYAVVAYGLRPSVRDGQGEPCGALLARCWGGEPRSRPSAQEALGVLERVRSQHSDLF